MGSTIASIGSSVYALNDQSRLHCDNGPAVILKDGTEKWYRNGELHREDGPAIVNPDGTHAWYIYNTNVTIKVNAWLCENGYSLPLTPEQLFEFKLRFT